MTAATRILAFSSPGEIRAAAVAANVLLDVAIDRPGRPDGVGDIHRGRAAARVPALAGVFVTLADGEGFLPEKEGGSGILEGDPVAVRVTRAAQGGKGPRLAIAAGIDPGEGGPALLSRGPGGVERLAALHQGADVFVSDPALAASLRPALHGRVHLIAVLDDAVEQEIDDLGETGVALPRGMRASIHPTPALTAIDVDAGAATAIRAPKAAAQLAANRAALPEVARQIRLRNLSGAILLDLAGMPAGKRQALGPDLQQALASDPLRPRLLGFTRLGLAEIVRTRVHPPLYELLRGPHAAGLAALRKIAQGAGLASRPGARLAALRAAPDVVTALRNDPIALRDFARRFGREASLRSDPRLSPGAAIVEDSGPVGAHRA